eukprot:gene6833-30807_t
MLEIGVQSGGSTRVWRQYYGSKLGLDVNPKCKRSEVKEEHTYIVTGSQTDTLVMEKICKEHGPFDVIVDDGAHSYTTISASLLYGGHLIPTMIKNIFVSMHTYWGIDSDTTGHMDPEYAPLQRYITAVHLYDSIMFIQKGSQTKLVEFPPHQHLQAKLQLTLQP